MKTLPTDSVISEHPVKPMKIIMIESEENENHAMEMNRQVEDFVGIEGMIRRQGKQQNRRGER